MVDNIELAFDEFESRIDNLYPKIDKQENVLNIMDYCDQIIKQSLWKRQKFILKVFYNLPLGQEEQDEVTWLQENKGLKIPDNHERINFKELVIVAGRRGSKSVLASIIATYEVYKLLNLSNPQKFYGIIPGTSIYALHCASETKQAEIVQDYIKGFVKSSEWFQPYIDDILEKEIRFFTDFDRDIKQEKGTIRTFSLTSNSSSIPGRTAIIVILDELARMMDTKGRLSGHKIYQSIVPSIIQFKEYGKIVNISSPLTKGGIFYDLYLKSQQVESMVCFQYASYELNDTLTREDLQDEFDKNPEWAMMEYGGEFGEVLDAAFDWEKIDQIVKPGTDISTIGVNNYNYIITCDPATVNDRYAIAWGHIEYVQKNKHIIIDGLKYYESEKFRDEEGNKRVIEVDLEEADNFVMKLIASLKHVGCIAYDQGKSTASIQKLKKLHHRALETPFTSKYKTMLYNDMKAVTNQGTLKVYENDPQGAVKLLIDEMKHLERQINGDIIKVGHPMIGPVVTDDLYDAVSNLVHILLSENPKQIKKNMMGAPRFVSMGR